MAAKNGPVQPGGATTTFGLLACGSSGPWSVDVDETTSGPDRWFVRLEGPSVYFSFEIPSLDVVEQLARFLGPLQASAGRQFGQGSGADWELVVGADGQTPVRLLRDDEFDDRFFLMFGALGEPIVRYALTGADVKCVAAALEQAREDLPKG
jgi:hypothetical protein